jgi:hypothetical protein
VVTVLLSCRKNETLDSCCIFSDEPTVHLSGMVNKQKVCLWGSKTCNVTVVFALESPKVNVFGVLSRAEFYSTFFFAQATVTGIIYLHMLEQWLWPQWKDDFLGCLFFSSRMGHNPIFPLLCGYTPIISYPKVA